MSEQLKWAEKYLSIYEKYIALISSANTVVGSIEFELYCVAKAIITDATGPDTEEPKSGEHPSVSEASKDDTLK